MDKINYLSDVITEADQARGLFGEQTLSSVAQSGQSGLPQDIENAVRSVKADYAKLKSAVSGENVSRLAERKERRDREVAELDNALAEQLKGIESKYSAMSVEQRAEKKYVKEYKDEINGAKTVHQRSMRKLMNDYDSDVVDIKSQEMYLCQARNRLLAEAKGKKSEGFSLETSALGFKASFNPKRTLTDARLWKSLAPLLVLLALFVAYVLACNLNNYTLNIDTILTSGIYVAVVAVGAVFIYSQGAFDMSLGNACLVCAAVGIMSYAATGNIFLSFILSVFLGVVLGIVNAILANCLRLPVMVMTLTMQSVLSAIYSNITADKGGYIEVQAIRGIGGMTMKWIILIAFVIFCVILFNYTKIGRRSKMIGANATCAKFTGISLMKAGIISFAISGIGLGLCGFLYITQMGSVNATGTALTSVGLNVIIAINLGGMPTSGGPKSRISAAIIGGFFCVILDELFAAMGLDLYRYVAKGIIFLVAVCLTSFGDRPKRLA
ncbi:MAG: ABC transporter permease [Candidatus Coproplasma sp.]